MKKINAYYSVFFNVGLGVSLALVILAFNYTTY